MVTMHCICLSLKGATILTKINWIWKWIEKCCCTTRTSYTWIIVTIMNSFWEKLTEEVRTSVWFMNLSYQLSCIIWNHSCLLQWTINKVAVDVFFAGLVTLDEMKARREDLVREHEKQLAAQIRASEEKRLVSVMVNNFSNN